MASHRCKARGITLLELLIALAVVALLMALAAPGFADLRRGANLSASANQMVGALHFARSAAILRGLPTVVCLTTDGVACLTAGAAGSGWLVFHDVARSVPPQLGGSDQLLRQGMLPVDVTVKGTRAALTYWPTTRGGTTGTFTFCDARGDAQGRAIVVSQTGRPRAAGAVQCMP